MKAVFARVSLIVLASVVVASGAERTVATKAKRKPKTDGPSMEQLLQKGFHGEVIQKAGENPASGVQRPRKALSAAKKKAGPSHLRVVLDVGQDGTVDVVSVTELPGEAALNGAPRGDVVYEFTEGDKALVAEALAGDPFVGHAFGGGKGHTFVPLPRATIVTTIPNRGKKSALEGLNFKLYRLQAGPALERVNKFEIEKLKKGGRLKTLAQLPAAKLGPALRAGSSLPAKPLVTEPTPKPTSQPTPKPTEKKP